MTKKISTLGGFVEEFENYKSFFFSNEVSKGLWANEELKVVIVSNELFTEFIEKATSTEVFLAKNLLESKLKTSKYRKFPVNSIDYFIEKLNQESNAKYLIMNEVVKDE